MTANAIPLPRLQKLLAIRSHLVVILLLFLTIGSGSTGCSMKMRRCADLPDLYPGVDFTVTNSPVTLARLNQIMVPSVKFKDADMSQVVDFIESFSREYEKTHHKKAIRYNVTYGGTIGSQSQAPDPRISFEAENISLLEVIKTVAQIADVDYVIYDKDVLEFRAHSLSKETSQ